jgi:WD40 repeat protein
VNIQAEMTAQPILELSTTKQLSGQVNVIAWSPLEQTIENTLAAACRNGEVYLFQNFVGITLCPATGNSIDALAFSFDGKWLAAGGLDGNITLWRIDSCSERLRQQDSPEIIDTIESGSWIYRLVWSPTCNHLAFNLGKAVKIWDADRAELVASLWGVAAPQDIRWSPDGQNLAIATKNDIHIWNTHNWDDQLYQWELNSPASTLAWSPDGAYLACAIHDHSISILNWSKVKYLGQDPIDETDLPARMSGFPGKVRQLVWADLPLTANFPPFLAASTPEIIAMWVKTPLDWENWVIQLNSGQIIDVAFRPKSGLLASLATDGSIVLWQTAVDAVQILDGTAAGLCHLAWHPTGCRLAAGGQKGELFIWSVCR